MVQKGKLDLNSAELTTLFYVIITSIVMLFVWPQLSSPWSMVELRIVAIGIIIITRLTYRFMTRRLALAWRTIPLFTLLIWWYPEIYEFCSLFPYQDHVFAEIDQALFGCQPALVFDQWLSSAFWSELFNMGYYSYYYLMFSVMLFYLIWCVKEYERATFIFLGSFFLFYLIYDFLPVAGPQYYFCALKNLYGDESWDHSFPSVGYYFKENLDMLVPEVKGVFGQLVVGAQEIGERPEAAYPSSHVGMSTVCMFLAWRTGNKWLLWCLVPFYILLCCGTVYIKAHYLIDTLSGFVFAALFYYLTNRVYENYRR